MAPAFNHDGSLPRLIRYVDPGTLPGRDILSIYDKSQNLLIIDSEHFKQLTELERRAVFRTERPVIYVDTRTLLPNKRLAA